ncbi:hypothetical protein H5410_056344 [Solanum commersonii]|uniref:Uncharacterized protein n=1 Tax=Solanum commersonii TaxID=4109 RepID=A0A9J5WL12_SOLCO|nr:hypothetical protein H5410_056344 [Solanum commersonii]
MPLLTQIKIQEKQSKWVKEKLEKMGEERNRRLVSNSGENTAAYCKRKPKSSKGQVYTTYSDKDNTALVKLIPKRLCSSLRRASGKPIAISVDRPQEDPFSKPSLVIMVQVTRSVQCDLDAVLLTKSTKKSRREKSMFVHPLNPVDIIDDTIEAKKDKKRKRNVSMGSSKEQVQINLPQLILSHIHRICVHDNKDHGLVYRLWLGEIFEYFQVPVKEWQVQTTKDVFGEVDHAAIPATSRGENAPMLEHVGLVEENSRLKEELSKTQASLDTERSSNYAHLKHIVDLLAKGSPSSSYFVPPSV